MEKKIAKKFDLKLTCSNIFSKDETLIRIDLKLIQSILIFQFIHGTFQFNQGRTIYLSRPKSQHTQFESAWSQHTFFGSRKVETHILGRAKSHNLLWLHDVATYLF